MTDQEKIALLNKLIEIHSGMDDFLQAFDALFGVQNGFVGSSDGLYRVHERLFDEFKALVAEKIGDTVEGVDWFIYDNHCGVKGLECRHTDSEEPFYIKSAIDYINFLNFCNEQN